MSSFEYTDEDGDHLTCRPMLGIPAILLRTDPNGVVIPLTRLEEIIAGQRDMARQAGRAAPSVAPCSVPDRCEDGTLCDRHEFEQAHAEGEHEQCSVDCEAKFPDALLRNGLLAGTYPGAAGMLDELLRRASAAPR